MGKLRCQGHELSGRGPSERAPTFPFARRCHAITLRRMSEKWLQPLSLAAAIVIVGGGLYVLLDKAAPLVTVAPEPLRKSVAPSVTPPPYVQPQSPSQQQNEAAIYRCDRRGSVTYSDAPCEGGRVVDIRVTQGFQAERYRPATRLASAEVPASTADRSAAQPETAKNTAVCEQINEAIEAIDAAARAGGSIQYMEELKERRRKLVEKRQELRC